MRLSLLCLSVLLTHVIPLTAADVELPAGIDLTAVTDRSALSFEEAAPYYGILAHVRDVSATDLRAASDRFRQQHWESSPRFNLPAASPPPVFVDLIEDPAAFRGQPVTLSGHLIRLVKSSAGPNEFDIDTLYEGWLVTDDSQQHPATIICTNIPPGMPIGEETIDGVSVTGYFLKLRTYPSRDRKTRFAPLILAQTLAWNPPKSLVGWGVSPVVLYGGLAVGTITVIVMGWSSARRHRRLRDARYRQSVPDEPPEFLESLNA